MKDAGYDQNGRSVDTSTEVPSIEDDSIVQNYSWPPFPEARGSADCRPKGSGHDGVSRSSN
jgi:hypothetical protein